MLEGLREQGLVEGRNLVIERRFGEGKLQRVPGYARELAAMKLDAVIATCTQTTLLAQKVFGSRPDVTPIVMAAVADPLGQRIIASLARPGANVTGLARQAEDILPKMLSLFATVLPDEPFFLASRAQIVALAAKHRLPAFYGVREFVDEGGLMGYGESLRSAYRGLGRYIDKIVSGGMPADIPVTQPTEFELVINLQMAKSPGLAMPRELLLSANALIP